MIAAPWTARSATSHSRLGANGTSRPTPTARAIAQVIIRVRPNRSDRALSGRTNSASAPVAADTVQLA